MPHIAQTAPKIILKFFLTCFLQVNEKVQEIRTDDPSYLETRIQVDRQEVEEYFGKDGFICECYAHSYSNSDSQDIVKSDSAKVEIASKKRFFGNKLVFIIFAMVAFVFH